MNSSTSYFLSRNSGGLDLKTNAVRNVQPTGRRILIIGGGVTGLTTAWALLDAGYAVTVIAERWAPALPRITSQIAGALWEWPPAVCGKHTDVISLTNSKRWCMSSYKVFDQLSTTEPSVRMRTANFFYDRKIEAIPDELSKMLEIQNSEIRGFVRDPNLITRHAVNQNAGVVDSYAHTSPVIDTDAYMLWLRDLVAKKGARLVTGRISGDLLDSEDKLLAEHNAFAIVNATGLAGMELAGDETVYPLRGALIRVVNDGKRFPKVTEALCVTHDNTRGEDEDIVFIVPRNDNILILGGLAQPGRWELDLTMESPEIQRMRQRCNNFVPGLENAEYDPEAALVQGLRPFRQTNVRVERELRPNVVMGGASRIVHTYGQGGAGFSLSFGCAADVLNLIEELEHAVKPRKMSMNPVTTLREVQTKL